MSNTQKLAYSFVSIHDVFTDRHECTAYTQRHRQSSEMIFCHRSLEINENSWPLPERNFFRINISGFGCLVPAIGDNGRPLSVLPAVRVLAVTCILNTIIFVFKNLIFSIEAFFFVFWLCFIKICLVFFFFWRTLNIAARIQKYHTVSDIETCYWLALCQPATVNIFCSPWL